MTTIDANAYLGRWPFRRTPCDETPRLLERRTGMASPRPGWARWKACFTATWTA